MRVRVESLTVQAEPGSSGRVFLRAELLADGQLGPVAEEAKSMLGRTVEVALASEDGLEAEALVVSCESKRFGASNGFMTGLEVPMGLRDLAAWSKLERVLRGSARVLVRRLT